MPILHLTQDSKYCIRGNPHGIGFCTWQVGDNALRYLRDRGVGDGGEVAGSEVKYLLQQRWIWTEGTGPGAEEGRETYVPRVIVEQLVAWARKADLRGLSAALHDGYRDYAAQCFTSSYLNWLASLDPDLDMPDFDDLSEPDFSDLATDRLGRLVHPLLERCIEQSWMEVPWRLASLVGRVARYVEDEATWPARWDKDYPILKAIYFRVRDFHNRVQRGFHTKPIPRRQSLAIPTGRHCQCV